MRLYIRILILFFLSFHLIFSYGQSQDSEVGLPLIQNYSAEDYGAATGNWAAVQDSMGRMYFANGFGVLVYDGANWDLLELPNKGSVLAIAMDEAGKIYVGGANEMGYIHTDSIGQLAYTSLLPLLDEKYQDLDNIRKIYFTEKGVVFGSETSIYRLAQDSFKVWEFDAQTMMFYANKNLFMKTKGKGLMELKKDEFVLVLDGDVLKKNFVTSITEYDPELLLVSSTSQLYLYDGESFQVFEVNAPDFFKKNIIYTISRLNDGSFAIGSLHKGILIIDKSGKTKIRLSKKGLLRNNQVTNLFVDNTGNLWATLFSGIAKIEYPSPFSFYYNSTNNAPDRVVDFVRWNKKLYMASSMGLHYLDMDDANVNIEIKDDKINFGTINDIIPFNDNLLVGTGTGVFEMNNSGFVKVYKGRIQSLHNSEIDTNRVFIGLYPGLISMYLKNGKWKVEENIEGIKTRPLRMIQDKFGSLWISTDKNEVIRVSFNSHVDSSSLTISEVKVFASEEGLPNTKGHIYIIEDRVYYKSNDEVHLFDFDVQRFEKDEILFSSLGLEDRFVKLNWVDKDGNIWLIEYDEDDNRIDQLIAYYQKDGKYKLESLQESRIISARQYVPFPELEDSVVWYRGKPGIVRHDLTKKNRESRLESHALISKIFYNRDSLLFGGYGKNTTPSLAFDDNEISFLYSSASFYEESKTQYQYILQGFDDDWSSWTTETQKDYTNIPVGEFEFRVRSKNILNEIGKEDVFAFTILPPWYRTWWMYLLYGVSIIGVIYNIVRWRSKDLLRKNVALEDVVNERTIEIQQKNDLLNHQTEKLLQLNTAKTQLYNNITHEFRTPLTVIQGMADELRTNIQENQLDKANKSIEMIDRNGAKLLSLVNEMLDLAKLESGSMYLNLVQSDIIPFVKYLSESFHSFAEQKNIVLTVYSEIDGLVMDFDASKLGTIISNLLSNAVKFTESRGKVIVHLNQIVENGNDFFFLKVKDTGSGLTEKELKHIFDRFYQVDQSSTRRNEGTGIGLALTKELVELMGGTITVISTLGKGSEFITKFPVNKNAIYAATSTLDSELVSKNERANENEKGKGIEQLVDDLPLVLIIEDNDDVAHYLQTCLSGKYQSIHATDGLMGIEKALELIPDIIISDVMMPKKDGFEVCKALKSDLRTDHIPIILLTAKVDMKDRLMGLSLGADAYLGKPFVKAELFTRLDQLTLLRKKLMEKISGTGYNQIIKQSSETPEAKFIKQCVSVIYKEINNHLFGTVHFARALSLSESQVYRKLKAITGKSTAVFIRKVRLDRAKELLRTTEMTISEVAYEVGFNDPSWFSRAFKEEYGYAPSELML